MLAVYRLRWQIELAFKRLKSLLHIDRLPTRTDGRREVGSTRISSWPCCATTSARSSWILSPEDLLDEAYIPRSGGCRASLCGGCLPRSSDRSRCTGCGTPIAMSIVGWHIPNGGENQTFATRCGTNLTLMGRCPPEPPAPLRPGVRALDTGARPCPLRAPRPRRSPWRGRRARGRTATGAPYARMASAPPRRAGAPLPRAAPGLGRRAPGRCAVAGGRAFSAPWRRLRPVAVAPRGARQGLCRGPRLARRAGAARAGTAAGAPSCGPFARPVLAPRPVLRPAPSCPIAGGVRPPQARQARGNFPIGAKIALDPARLGLILGADANISICPDGPVHRAVEAASVAVSTSIRLARETKAIQRNRENRRRREPAAPRAGARPWRIVTAPVRSLGFVAGVRGTSAILASNTA